MKKFIFLGTFCFTFSPLMAQSTCETRVDAHQEATTVERVAYCLTPAYAAPSQTHSNLVFSSVSMPAAQPAAKPAEKVTTKDGTFKPEHYSVSQKYVDSAQFPQVLQGNTIPVPVSVQAAQPGTFVVATQEFEYVPSPTIGQETPQKIAAAPEMGVVLPTARPQAAPIPMDVTEAMLAQDEFEYVSAPSTPLGRSEIVWVKTTQTPTASEAPATQGSSPVDPRERFMIDEVDAQGNLVEQTQVTETKAGLQVRQHKSGRQLIKAAEAEQTPAAAQIPAQDPAYTYHEDLTQPYEPETIPAGTVTYAPAAPPAANTTYDEIPAGTVSYAPATAN